jgi:two-component system response regulator
MAQDLILLVEDDPDDQELTVSTLRKHGIGRVAMVEDGLQALDYLDNVEHELPRVVLLDLKLPRMDGFEVLKRIRQNPRTALVPVVVMTSSKEEQDRVSSYRHGANSFVTKPINFETFRRSIQHLGVYWLGLNEPARY